MEKRVQILKARELRKDQTTAEERLWWILRSRKMLDYKFRRQYVLKGFIIDYYCPQAKLAIELDGGIHQKQVEYDKLRQELIESRGIKMIRFTNTAVFSQPVQVLEEIINNLSLSAFSSKRRRGTASERSESSGG